ncbi:MAG: tRNA threonylcarbamoyladenosine dehydratase [Spirochaetales bacterium]|nr:tRNA threonylcarbamoyladenosine dehydratase [Spirochaetales bacterium]
MERFYRTSRLLGTQALATLLSSRVAVVGLGAVGSYSVEGLARLGVGNLLLIDHDLVSFSNINRQLFALESTLGQAKTEVAVHRVLDINPGASVTTLRLFIDKDHLHPVTEWKPDLVVDAIDSLTPKADLLAGMYHAGIPVVSSMGAALRKDPSLIRTGDIFDTSGCPLARKVRSLLRRRDVGKGISCVFSTEIPEFDYLPPDMEGFKEEAPGKDLPRNLLGSLATLTGIFGLTLAHLAMETLLAKKTSG